jgi:hypothetical protein
MMEIAGVLFKVTDVGRVGIESIVVVGFIVFAFSIIAT